MEKEGGKRVKRKVEGKHKCESDDITSYDTMTLDQRVYTQTYTETHTDVHNCELVKTSLHMCVLLLEQI